eukprot:gene1793-2215_t
MRDLNEAQDVNAVELNGIHIAFPLQGGGTYEAVGETNLVVSDREFVAIVGPTGCGKSTLLNATAGLLKPAQGQVRTFAKPLSGLNKHAGYLFQQDSLMPWKTAIDNVAIGLEVAGTPRRDALEQARVWLVRAAIPRGAPGNLECPERGSSEGLSADGRGPAMNRLTLISLQVLVAVVTLVFWHIASTTTLIGNPKTISFFFAEPLAVGKRMIQWFMEGSIWYHLGITLTEAALAFIIGSLGGVIIGFWFARKPLLAAVFDPYVKAANALPRVVLAPIFALWLGLGIWSKVALGVTLVFFIVFFNVYQGVKEVSPAVLSNARMLGMNERQLLRHVYMPSALSWMFSSLHTSVGFAVVGAVVGEYLGSAAGLGYLIHEAESVFDVTGVFAGMFVLMGFVILVDWLVTLVENRLLVWRPRTSVITNR